MRRIRIQIEYLKARPYINLDIQVAKFKLPTVYVHVRLIDATARLEMDLPVGKG